jgi:hypothetical protein
MAVPASQWLLQPAARCFIEKLGRTMERPWKSHTPDAASRLNGTASPLNATVDEPSGLPQALMVTAENADRPTARCAGEQITARIRTSLE